MSKEDLEKLKTLKLNLRQGIVSDTLMIFVYNDNKFLVNEYVNKIVQIRGLDVEKLTKDDDLEQALLDRDNSLFDTNDKIIIYTCDKFELDLDASIKNVIVICKEYNAITSLDCIYEFPKLEDWQIVEYIKTNCKGLNSDECNWLYENTKNKYKNNECIYRLNNEIGKISCFDESEQSKVFNQISYSGGYDDLTTYNIFNFTNAIIKRDVLTLSKIIEEIENIDVDIYGLMTILHKNFKQVIDIQLGKNTTYETMGITQKQYNAIKYNCGKYTPEELIRIFEFLTSIDYKLKSGLLDIPPASLIDYIVCNVLV